MSGTEAQDVGNGASGERRQGERHRLVLRVAKLVQDGVEFPCIIKNVSHNGCRIKAFGTLPEANDYTLVLANGLAHPCEKRWSDGVHYGFQFADTIELASFLKMEFGAFPKRAIRVNTHRNVVIKRTGNDFSATVNNISQTGFCLISERKFGPEEEVEVRFGLSGLFLARHIWARGDMHGFRFSGLLPVETFAKLCVPDRQAELQPGSAPAPRPSIRRNAGTAPAFQPQPTDTPWKRPELR